MVYTVLFIQSAAKVQEKLTDTRIDDWLERIVFHGKWWLLLALVLFSMTFWWKTVDKRRLSEMVLYVSLIIIFTLVLDEIGEEFTLWDYPYDLIPLFPPMSSIDIACLPLIYSLIYQRFGAWKGFITATVLMSGTFCFILEPLFIRIGVYQILSWKSYYGFPIYIFMAIICKLAVKKIYTKSGA